MTLSSENLVIMVGGASSRMKRSLENSDLSDTITNIAQKLHKCLIPLGEAGRPLLYYLIKNAAAAGYKQVYLITSPENEGFKSLVGKKDRNNYYEDVSVHFAIQTIPGGRKKPLGTADALQQCLEQYTELKSTAFTVFNGDNLYSVGALKDLNRSRNVPNALIGYSSSGLQFSDERISKFALIDISPDGFLKGIVEKPDVSQIESYRDTSGELRVSMNIFSFHGKEIYPYLENCPIHPQRNEKELPEAVRQLVADGPRRVFCYPRSEYIPDLTNADDIAHFKK